MTDNWDAQPKIRSRIHVRLWFFDWGDYRALQGAVHGARTLLDRVTLRMHYVP